MDWLNAPGSNATTVPARPGQARAGRMWRMLSWDSRFGPDSAAAMPGAGRA